MHRETLPVNEDMPAWQRAWRQGIAPQLDDDALESLAVALATGDKRLLRGSTVEPPSTMATRDWPVEACCPMAFLIWQGETMTVAELEQAWIESVALCDKLTDGTASDFLRWWDLETEPVGKLLLEEIRTLQAARAWKAAGLPTDLKMAF